MRWKIIIVNSTIWIVLGVVAAVLMTVRLEDVLSNRTQRKSDAERALRSANMLLELDGLRLERWLASHSAEEDVVDIFASGTSQGRAENASREAKRLREAAAQSTALSGVSIPIVLFLDARGVVVGRNDSSQMRGEDLARAYPSIDKAISSGQTSSQVWLNRQRSEQLLVSCAPVRGDTGEVLGVLVAGTPLNDERLGAISQATSGQALGVAVARDGAGVELIATTASGAGGSSFASASERGLLGQAAAALGAGRAFFEDDAAVYAAEPLSGYDAAGVMLLAAASQSLVPSVPALLWPLGGVVLLGILLCAVGATFLSNYLAEPIAQLEEGLLSIINGRRNLRFDIEHPDLGGLVFRINSLLNALMGVPETDADGRTSQPPGARYREAEGP
jgi:hypothetical protein